MPPCWPRPQPLLPVLTPPTSPPSLLLPRLRRPAFFLAPPLLPRPSHRPGPSPPPTQALPTSVQSSALSSPPPGWPRAGPRSRWPCPEFPPSFLGRPLASFVSCSFWRLCPQAYLGLGDLFCPAAPRHRLVWPCPSALELRPYGLNCATPFKQLEVGSRCPRPGHRIFAGQRL